MGEVGQTSHVGLSLFAADALAALRTAVFAAGAPVAGAAPPTQLHVESSRVMAPVGEPLLPPVLPLLDPLLLPELDPLLEPPLEPPPLLDPLELPPPPSSPV